MSQPSSTAPRSPPPPRGFPPTPGSSSDLKAQDGTGRLPALQLNLPEPALTPSSSPAAERYRQQPAETVKARKRSATASKGDAAGAGTFALPPPPSRSRRIIQMNPQGDTGNKTGEQTGTGVGSGTASSSSKGKGKGKGTAAAGKTAATTSAGTSAEGSEGVQGTKRKAPSSSSAAGRKIARKTAHSLIERRRRSKMNEEFATLKSMVPACNSGDMHKLTILQATIEYLRYLKDCVDTLQTERKDLVKSAPPQVQHDTPQAQSHQLPSIREAFREPESATTTGGFQPPSSQPVSPATAVTPASFSSSPSSSSSTTGTTPATQSQHQQYYQQYQNQSPALMPQDASRRGRQASISSAASGYYGYTHSAGPSPALGPQYGNTQGMAALALTTPPLGPQNDLDQEATAALLMLNSDRRGSNFRNSRGLSVSDLLTK